VLSDGHRVEPLSDGRRQKATLARSLQQDKAQPSCELCCARTPTGHAAATPHKTFLTRIVPAHFSTLGKDPIKRLCGVAFWPRVTSAVWVRRCITVREMEEGPSRSSDAVQLYNLRRRRSWTPLLMDPRRYSERCTIIVMRHGGHNAAWLSGLAVTLRARATDSSDGPWQSSHLLAE
jgi:hypothetical protein